MPASAKARLTAPTLHQNRTMTDNPPLDRLAEVRKEIAARLEPFCAGWPPERFDLLVNSVTAITMKYDVSDRLMYDRRTTDRLIEDLKDLTRRLEESRDK
jgi:hypothetical protein